MNKLTIPAILVATVMVAGIFAFMPIEQASTVHQSTTGPQRLSEDIILVTVEDTDLVIECPATSNGCVILDVYIEENDTVGGGGADIDLGAVTATIDGDAVVISADLANLVDESREVIAALSGVALGSGDIITIVVVDGPSESAIYNMRVIAQITGTGEIDART